MKEKPEGKCNRIIQRISELEPNQQKILFDKNRTFKYHWVIFRFVALSNSALTKTSFPYEI